MDDYFSMPDRVARAVGLYHRACLLREEGQLAEAETLCAESLALLEQTEGPQSLNVASLWVTLSDIHLRSNQSEKCIESAKNALEILESINKALASPDLSLLRIRALNRLGMACRHTARQAEAETSFRAAFACALTEFGPTHAETILASNNLNTSLLT